MARGLDALAAGDGPTFLAVLQGPVTDRVRLFGALGAAADNGRWDVCGGRCVRFAADFLLEQPVAHVARFLPILAIAAAREHQYANATKRDRGAELLARLRPVVAQDEGAAQRRARPVEGPLRGGPRLCTRDEERVLQAPCQAPREAALTIDRQRQPNARS